MNDKNPLIVDSELLLIIIPELAVALGLNEAIIIQQIYYWININKAANRNFYNNKYWTFNTYEGWQEQFPFWSKNTIIRTLKSLENKGILIIGNFNKKGYDKTKWYTINRDNLEKLLKSIENAHVPKMSSPCTQNEQSMYPIWVDAYTQYEQTNTIEYTYNSSKSSSEISNYMVPNSDEIQNNSFDSKILIGQIKICYAMLLDENSSLSYNSTDYIEIFKYFYKCYEEYTGNTHPKIKNEHVKKVMRDLPYVVGDNVNEEVDVEDNKALIDAYFKQSWNEAINPTILHFMSENIRLHRYYEVFR